MIGHTNKQAEIITLYINRFLQIFYSGGYAVLKGVMYFPKGDFPSDNLLKCNFPKVRLVLMMWCS